VKTLRENYELTAGGVSVELSYVNGCFGLVKTDSGFVIQNHYSHIHDCIEIYINLSGRVSFIVNNLIFPVGRGDMIITSPGEYHRCVVHEYPHEHMCLWIRDKGESPLLAKLKNKKHNHVSFDDREEAERTTKLCEKLCDAFIDPAVSDAEKTMLFCSLLVTAEKRLAAQSRVDALPAPYLLPDELNFALEFIDENLSSVSVSDLCGYTHVSHSTLIRMFKRYIGLNPKRYILRTRLFKAKSLLEESKSDDAVSEIAQECGFSDCSGFISKFKKEFGMTPFQYRIRGGQNDN
jgi:AraC-like DNA-binding protein